MDLVQVLIGDGLVFSFGLGVCWVDLISGSGLRFIRSSIISIKDQCCKNSKLRDQNCILSKVLPKDNSCHSHIVEG